MGAWFLQSLLCVFWVARCRASARASAYFPRLLTQHTSFLLLSILALSSKPGVEMDSVSPPTAQELQLKAVGERVVSAASFLKNQRNYGNADA